MPNVQDLFIDTKKDMCEEDIGLRMCLDYRHHYRFNSHKLRRVYAITEKEREFLL